MPMRLARNHVKSFRTKWCESALAGERAVPSRKREKRVFQLLSKKRRRLESRLLPYPKELLSRLRIACPIIGIEPIEERRGLRIKAKRLQLLHVPVALLRILVRVRLCHFVAPGAFFFLGFTHAV